MTTESARVTLSIRVIRSFEHRNLRFFPLQNTDLNWTTEQLMTAIKEAIQKNPSLPPPFKKFEFDTLKVRNWNKKVFFFNVILLQIEHQAHGSKSNDPVINTENDLFLRNGATLKEADVRNETELAFFKLTDYQAYLQKQ